MLVALDLAQSVPYNLCL